MIDIEEEKAILEGWHKAAVERGEASEPLDWSKMIWREPIRCGDGMVIMYFDDLYFNEDPRWPT